MRALACLLLISAPAFSAPLVKSIRMANNHPKAWTGKCPTKLIFTANLMFERAGELKYKWARSDGGSGQEQVFEMKHPGGHSLHDDWEIGESFTGWVKFEDLTDHKYMLEHFSIKCK